MILRFWKRKVHITIDEAAAAYLKQKKQLEQNGARIKAEKELLKIFVDEIKKLRKTYPNLTPNEVGVILDMCHTDKPDWYDLRKLFVAPGVNNVSYSFSSLAAQFDCYDWDYFDRTMENL
jgi:hypothetical protein